MKTALVKFLFELENTGHTVITNQFGIYDVICVTESFYHNKTIYVDS